MTPRDNVSTFGGMRPAIMGYDGTRKKRIPVFFMPSRPVYTRGATPTAAVEEFVETAQNAVIQGSGFFSGIPACGLLFGVLASLPRASNVFVFSSVVVCSFVFVFCWCIKEKNQVV